MNDITIITDSNQMEIAIILRSSLKVEKTTFFSKQEHSQQVGIIKYPKHGKIRPHFHNELPREVVYTQEVLFIRKGMVKADLYDRELNFLKSVILNKGDVIFLISGGHGFEMLEDSEIFEVKQGPYSGVERDKTHFEAKLAEIQIL